MGNMGNRIRLKRIEKDMTMEELGNALGIKASAINKYEKGIVENIKRSTIQQMATLFECDPAWLMGFDETEKNVPDYIEGTVEIIDLYSRVTPEQRLAVLNLLRSFVSE